MIQLVDYDEAYLALSGMWLRDEEIKKLTDSPDFTDQQQQDFFRSLPARKDYRIFGINYHGRKIGAAGLKNIEGEVGEYWGYIGEKELWGKGLGQLIIAEVFIFARSIGVNFIFLKVSPDNIRAIKLYEKIGFKMSGDLAGLRLMNIDIGGELDV
ncbi:GNAT family N-acetyltransferase [Pseudomonas sp. ADAK13]|uniref:GNAT family N-acetyltransferase n=1 Tax=Pseudomonas sp. ADAK13 TaxID=2730847 RepID=UPI001462ED58|nr:GNAT family N-acetyltransferase [Pseudomonas sp. ADAK13]QJI36455.1 GNAT family N-acetyltransferase [Pseudomonas sp. ADAK13]